MFKRNKLKHTLEVSMEEGGSGRLTLKPPLDERAYAIGVQALRMTPYQDWVNPNERVNSDGTATEFIITVDSDRHLNGRANRLFDGLIEASVNVELGQSVRHH